MSKIVKLISKDNADISQLQSFMTTLGCKKAVSFYKYNDLVFTEIDIFLPILSVDIQWFLKNSRKSIHYVKRGRKIYINKYGLTKLLAQSYEPCAFKLQDYIYEVIYRLETKGTVSIDDVSSRKELKRALEELDEQKNLNATLEYNYKAQKSQLHCMENDVEILQLQIDEQIKRNKMLSNENDDLERKISEIKHINHKLASYVYAHDKTQYKKIAKKVDEEDVGINIDKEHIDQNKKYFLQQGMNVLHNKHTTDQETTYYLTQSVKFIKNSHGDELYNWKLIDKLPVVDTVIKNILYENFADLSDAYHLGDILPEDIDVSHVLYGSVDLSARAKSSINTLLDMISYASEKSVLQIINMI